MLIGAFMWALSYGPPSFGRDCRLGLAPAPPGCSAPWRIVRASVVGSSHIKSGTPCQDSSLHELIDCAAKAPVLVAVISDGAGSAEQAEIGSSTTCRAFVTLVQLFIGIGVPAGGPADRGQVLRVPCRHASADRGDRVRKCL